MRRFGSKMSQIGLNGSISAQNERALNRSQREIGAVERIRAELAGLGFVLTFGFLF